MDIHYEIKRFLIERFTLKDGLNIEINEEGLVVALNQEGFSGPGTCCPSKDLDQLMEAIPYFFPDYDVQRTPGEHSYTVMQNGPTGI